MFLLGENGSRACDVVVVNEAQQMFAAIEAPLLLAELALQRVADFEEVHGIEAGIQPLAAFVIGDAVAHGITHDLVVVAANHFADEEKFRFEGIAERTQTGEKAAIEAVGHIETQAVDLEVAAPAFDAGEQVLHHVFIVQVQLDKLVMAFPAFIPETVVVAVVATEIDVEPVAVGRIFPVFQHVLESPETTADVVEYAVKDDADSVFMQFCAQGGKALVGTETAINHTVIARIVSMAIALEYRAEIYGVHAQLQKMGDPLFKTGEARLRRSGMAVVLCGGAAEAERIDLIKIAVKCPHVVCSSLVLRM